ncbi:hypothetical protein [uncultured Ruminococcus sp.]|uniref:hypothetical protein n=1 Tax=uncultured Ruminococcus sp. TaxID=165186 RepID=UPI0029308B9C|nr:hypothetical protein [uncultured Ruminococcus sp.]
MSILIKGMEMPKHAIKNGTDDTLYRSCVIVHPDGTAELILDSTFADMFGFEHNLNRFPLVEIPSPHGDLIDKDVLLKEYESNPEDDQKMKNINLECYNLMTDIVGMVTENINEMPIIIGAEE